MAATALERLEREINGEAVAVCKVADACRPAARRRGRALAAARGRGRRSLSLRWQAGEATIEGDRCEVAQALDNLIVNAIEHGGPEVVVAARTRRRRGGGLGDRFRLPGRPEARRGSPA